MAEKMVMVPETVYLQHQQQQEQSTLAKPPSQATRLRHHLQPIEKNVTDLDTDIERILQRDLPEDEKVKRYFVILDRYLEYHKQRTQNRRGSLTFRKNISADSVGTELAKSIVLDGDESSQRESVVSSLPKASRDKADRLMRHMQHSGRVKWDSDGRVYINGRRIEGSNITDLLYEAVHHQPSTASRRLSIPGSNEFYKALDAINVPITLLNKSAREELITAQSTPEKEKLSAFPTRAAAASPSTSASPKRKRGRSTRQAKSLRFEEYTY